MQSSQGLFQGCRNYSGVGGLGEIGQHLQSDMGNDTDKYDDKEDVMTEGQTSINASHQLHRGGTLERQQSRKNVGMIRGASNLDMKVLNY